MRNSAGRPSLADGEAQQGASKAVARHGARQDVAHAEADRAGVAGVERMSGEQLEREQFEEARLERHVGDGDAFVTGVLAAAHGGRVFGDERTEPVRGDVGETLAKPARIGETAQVERTTSASGTSRSMTRSTAALSGVGSGDSLPSVTSSQTNSQPSRPARAASTSRRTSSRVWPGSMRQSTSTEACDGITFTASPPPCRMVGEKVTPSNGSIR